MIIGVHKNLELLQHIFANSAKVKGVEIILNLDEQLEIYADKNTFSTIFRNLLSNAIKFTNVGDTISFESEVLADKIVLSISDTGIGIPKERLETIFDLNHTKSTWGTAKEKGIGLGLRLAQEFTELNNGQISVKSIEGKGSTFFVEFPIAKGQF